MNRKYAIGDTINDGRVGTVISISLTAYQVRCRYCSDEWWVPFYGPNGVDDVAPVTPLVVLS